MNRSVLFLLLMFPAISCVQWKPADIQHSDPNLAAQQRTEKKIESDNINAFILDHPELDADTKQLLRDGTITIYEASNRLKKNKR